MATAYRSGTTHPSLLGRKTLFLRENKIARLAISRRGREI
jgi:hypothetical protein